MGYLAWGVGWLAMILFDQNCLVVSNIFHVHRENWGNDPFWLIFFKWVEITNLKIIAFSPPKKTRMEPLKDFYLLDSRFVSTFLKGSFWGSESVVFGFWKHRFVKGIPCGWTVSFVWAGEDGGANEGMPVSDADDEGRIAWGKIRNPFPSNQSLQ